MNPDLFWIPGPWRGKLAIVTRPRGGDWLEDEAAGWRRSGLNAVVSLLESDEAAQLELAHEGQAAESNGVLFISFPIPDLGVPVSIQEALALLKTIGGYLEAGKSVAVHCRQGIGRSGLIAAGVLMAFGAGAEKAIEVVSAARGLTIPETRAQLEWLHQLTSEYPVVSAS
jgi:protein-tyrosine phosphatase